MPNRSLSVFGATGLALLFSEVELLIEVSQPRNVIAVVRAFVCSCVRSRPLKHETRIPGNKLANPQNQD